MIRTVSPIRNRHLVREIDKGRVRELLVVVMLAGCLLAPLLIYVWNHMEWIRVGYELERLEKERLAQAELGSRLRIEKAALSSLKRVESQASRRLGLVPAAAVARLTGEPEGSGPGKTARAPRLIQTGSVSLLGGRPGAGTASEPHAAAAEEAGAR